MRQYVREGMGVVDELGERITSEQRRVLARALQCQWDSDSDSTGESLGSEDTEEDEEHDVGAWVDRRRWVTVTNNNVPSQGLAYMLLAAPRRRLRLPRRSSRCKSPPMWRPHVGGLQ